MTEHAATCPQMAVWTKALTSLRFSSLFHQGSLPPTHLLFTNTEWPSLPIFNGELAFEMLPVEIGHVSSPDMVLRDPLHLKIGLGRILAIPSMVASPACDCPVRSPPRIQHLPKRQVVCRDPHSKLLSGSVPRKLSEAEFRRIATNVIPALGISGEDGCRTGKENHGDSRELAVTSQNSAPFTACADTPAGP